MPSAPSGEQITNKVGGEAELVSIQRNGQRTCRQGNYMPVFGDGTRCGEVRKVNERRLEAPMAHVERFFWRN